MFILFRCNSLLMLFAFYKISLLLGLNSALFDKVNILLFIATGWILGHVNCSSFDWFEQKNWESQEFRHRKLQNVIFFCRSKRNALLMEHLILLNSFTLFYCTYIFKNYFYCIEEFVDKIATPSQSLDKIFAFALYNPFHLWTRLN